MHTDNLTREEIKEILVYSASHHAVWQIINNFKSILWYKYSQGPGTWPFTSHIPPLHNTPSFLDFKQRFWQDHCWQRAVCNDEVSLPPAPAKRNTRQSHRNPAVSGCSSHVQALRGQGHSVHQEVPPCSCPDLLGTPDIEAIICHSQQKKGCWA